MTEAPLGNHETDEVDLIVKLDKLLDSLKEFDLKKQELSSVDRRNGPEFFRVFLRGFDRVIGIIKLVERALSDASNKRKAEESKALIERSYDHYANNEKIDGKKITDNLRKAYVDMDEEVIKARNREASLKSFLNYLQDKKDSYKMVFYASKLIYQNEVGSASDSNWEANTTPVGQIGQEREEFRVEEE